MVLVVIETFLTYTMLASCIVNIIILRMCVVAYRALEMKLKQLGPGSGSCSGNLNLNFRRILIFE